MINSQKSPIRFSDAAVRRFLLGQLNASEQSAFEFSLFTDHNVESRARLAEFALTDDYARDWLRQPEKNRFHECYLITSGRQQMLGVSQALHNHFSARTAARTGLAQRLRNAFEISQPAWRYAFAALILLIALATLWRWRGIKEPRSVQQIVPQRGAPKPTASPAPQRANHPDNTSSPKHLEEYPALPPHSVALSVPLDVQNTADNPVVVTLPTAENSLVRFEVEVANETNALYQAEVLSLEGESLLTIDSLAATNDSKLSFDVPAQLLKAGDYQIRLSRKIGGRPEVITTYYFRAE